MINLNSIKLLLLASFVLAPPAMPVWKMGMTSQKISKEFGSPLIISPGPTKEVAWWTYMYPTMRVSALVGEKGMVAWKCEGLKGQVILDGSIFTLGTTFGRMMNLGKPENYYFGEKDNGVSVVYSRFPNHIFTYSEIGNEVVLTKVFCSKKK